MTSMFVCSCQTRRKRGRAQEGIHQVAREIQRAVQESFGLHGKDQVRLGRRQDRTAPTGSRLITASDIGDGIEPAVKVGQTGNAFCQWGCLHFVCRSSGPVSFGYSELENNNAQQASILSDFASQTTPGVDRSGTSLRNELRTPSEESKSPMKSTVLFTLWILGFHEFFRLFQHQQIGQSVRKLTTWSSKSRRSRTRMSKLNSSRRVRRTRKARRKRKLMDFTDLFLSPSESECILSVTFSTFSVKPELGITFTKSLAFKNPTLSTMWTKVPISRVRNYYSHFSFSSEIVVFIDEKSNSNKNVFLLKSLFCFFSSKIKQNLSGGWVHPGDFASAGLLASFLKFKIELFPPL